MFFCDCFTFAETRKMIEVFKTNVQQPADAARLEALLANRFPDCAFNFDLDDCDKIFRIESRADVSEQVIDFFSSQDYCCTILL